MLFFEMIINVEVIDGGREKEGEKSSKSALDNILIRNISPLETLSACCKLI